MEKEYIIHNGINRTREISNEVRERVQNNEDRTTIYTDMCTRYHEEYLLAQLMGSIPEKDDFPVLNDKLNRLSQLIIIWAVLRVIYNVIIILDESIKNVSALYILPIAFVIPIAVISAIRWMKKKQDFTYFSIIPSLAFFGAINNFSGLLDDSIDFGNIVLVIINVIPVCLLIWIGINAHRIKKSYFPQIKFVGGAKQKSDGTHYFGRIDFEQDQLK